jgi:dTMP kinase
MGKGLFITFEGGEGSGKSTQARLLAADLRARGLDVLATREPGGSPFAETVRSLILDPVTPSHTPLAEALLFCAARADHLAATIRPALAGGRHVIADRFSDSTRVYQCHAGGLPRADFDLLERLVVGETRPDLTFILDLPAPVGLARAARRRSAIADAEADATDRFERRDLGFHETLRQGFAEIARQEPDRCRLIDGTLAESAIASVVLAAALERIGSA